MPKIIRNIECNILDNYSGEIELIKIEGNFGTDDYFKVFGMEGFIQNFTKVSYKKILPMTNPYGLRVNRDRNFNLLEISY